VTHAEICERLRAQARDLRRLAARRGEELATLLGQADELDHLIVELECLADGATGDRT
jgi:hypothetical protein